ncbi:DNA repair protein [Candidatus Methylobacter favarea]|uniref:DNA repair protein RecN n=1 Tax=Candidatus Methylobacter favarea TaxID=2707345 RepID=A0A8S0WPS6_9GAMM|nr:AAA family ATPase [Candidatus Methylobacter favarea]CAA9891065.1 DNA repair protein [Candidatus Methylobacter favarea]
MVNTYTKARFWKCALQVNPAGYIAYRGTDHGMTEEQYNQELVRLALENDIKVVGLADHGNVDGVDAIRNIMNQNGILVFPGFEIASCEKAHFVCLYPEDTTTVQLHRYLGDLQLLDPEDGVCPSSLSAQQLLQKVENEQGGFIYAAHCTDDSGLLKLRLNHIWKNELLKAAQIPGALDDLKNEVGNGYRQILLNKDPGYKRELQIGIINAKDVANPGDLANPKASCLIKMTKPSFASFKLAFQDPESRVRLNSDVAEKYYSQLERMKITGGYLDGIEIEFSEHLNSVIGGRGTGKSTLLECIRYVLGIRPIGKIAQKQHDEIIKENLGKTKARVELTIRSSDMNGKRFKLSRRYGESISVQDEEGKPSAFTPVDLLPGIEIYGQNEIYEIAQDANSQRQLLERFLEKGLTDVEKAIHEAIGRLSENRKKLVEAQSGVSVIEDEVARLPKLEEQVGQFKTLGIEGKLKIVPLLETEKRLLKRVLEEEGPNLKRGFLAIQDCLPDTTFLSDVALDKLPHADNLREIRAVLNTMRTETEAILQQWLEKYGLWETQVTSFAKNLNTGIKNDEDALEKTFKELPACEGKTGKQIGIEYQRLMQEIERIRPKQTLIATRKQLLSELHNQRRMILVELSAKRAERSAQFERTLKKLNKRLTGKLRLQIKTEANRTPVIDFLLGCRLDGVGEGRLSWIREADTFSPVRLAELIRAGTEALRDEKWGITPTVAEALVRLTPEKILELEEIELSDSIEIELNTAHEGQENFRPLNKLSTGQQCTAILHLLLLENLDPLIMDQPEDNLDNAFIADRIVTELRSAKIARQFIFATHNANIPVFGDAEWIGVFEASDGQAHMPANSQGAIDVPHVRDKAADILEGGKAAFNQRKAKYGY